MKKTCMKCKGIGMIVENCLGYIWQKDCPECKGKGYVEVDATHPPAALNPQKKEGE